MANTLTGRLPRRPSPVNDAVRFAVQKCYEVVKISDVYDYAVTQYDPQTGPGGLFVEYIDTFFKLKTKVSGNPDRVQTPEDEDRFIANFLAREGIRLDKDVNAAKRPWQNYA